jgi:hypothetical protein
MRGKGNMTAQELLEIAREGRPSVKYVTNDKQDCIGAWSESLGRYVIVAGLMLDGMWAHMPVELLINGKPCERVWIET